MNEHPIEQFIEWYKEAENCKSIRLPEAMSLSTVDNGFPDARVMLLKHVDKKGFVFFTNYNSSKGKALEKNPNVCMLFFWEKLSRQVRIRGSVEKTKSNFIVPLLNTVVSATLKVPGTIHHDKTNDDIQSDTYFKTRSRESQIGAWSSNQSQEIENRAILETNIKKEKDRFKNKEVPRPPHWGGYRLVPIQIEFWKDKKFRLHERILYIKNNRNHKWTKKILSP